MKIKRGGGKTVLVVIPVYEPDNLFVDFVSNLLKQGVTDIIIVDDGSGTEYREIFDNIQSMEGIVILRHAVNLGKGRSLKDAFNFALNEYPDLLGVVTADSDGQHTLADIKSVIDVLRMNPKNFILGCRRFRSDNVPWKSRIGNELTKKVFSFLCGIKVSDTQTGLRGIPADFMEKLLLVSGERFEFETNMLLACGENLKIIEIPIQTVYESKDSHKTHFDPVRDSVRIYKILLEYAISSFAAAFIDFIVFTTAVRNGIHIWGATAAARVCSAFINFMINKNVVFKAEGNVFRQWIKYILLVFGSGSVSAVCTNTLSIKFTANVVLCKAGVEICLFFFNYYIQRVFIFVREEAFRKNRKYGERYKEKTTDWTAYYEHKKSWFSVFTQRFTLHEILNYIKVNGAVRIIELGGGNSCFAKDICKAKNVSIYDIVDSNELGVSRFNKMKLQSDNQKGIQQNLLEIDSSVVRPEYDFVFSVGLIEHFSGKDIDTVIRRHFEYCKSEGIVCITFPTPTLKYRLIRKCMEIIGVWQFWDEKPLTFDDVKESFQRYGAVEKSYINKKLPLSQMIVVAKKKNI